MCSALQQNKDPPAQVESRAEVGYGDVGEEVDEGGEVHDVSDDKDRPEPD